MDFQSDGNAIGDDTRSRSPRLQSLPTETDFSLSIYAISDLHTDYAQNLEWVRSLPAPLPPLLAQPQEQGQLHSCTRRDQQDQGQLEQPEAMLHHPQEQCPLQQPQEDGCLQHQRQPRVSDGAVRTVLLVAGDVSDNLETLRETLELLVAKFDRVFFVPGNHELWLRGGAAAPANAGASDSVAKLSKVLDVCASLGVATQPARLGRLWLVPVLSWHHQSWDREPDVPGVPRASRLTVSDYAACEWPAAADGGGDAPPGGEALAAWFDGLNDGPGAAPGAGEAWRRLWGEARTSSPACGGSDAAGGDEGSARGWPAGGDRSEAVPGAVSIISFSHFLPHQALLPEKRFLAYPNLAKAVGSDFLWRRVQRLRPNLHVFGHSHFAWDARLEGMRFIQAPLAYPSERKARRRSLTMQPGVAANATCSADATSPSSHASHPASPGASPTAATPPTHRAHGQAGQGGAAAAASMAVGAAAGAPEALVPWLPVLVYQAQYTAELFDCTCGQRAAGPASGACGSSGSRHGLDGTLAATGELNGDVDDAAGIVGDGFLLPGPARDPRAATCDGLASGGRPCHSADISAQSAGSSVPYSREMHHDAATHDVDEFLWSGALLASCGVPVVDTCCPALRVVWRGPVYRLRTWHSNWCPELHGLWSDHYSTQPRQPGNVQLAPWVLQRYARFKGRAARMAAAHGDMLINDNQHSHRSAEA